MSDHWSTEDATAQADAVRRGDVKPIELVDAAIARIERLNPQLNAVVSSQYERARAEAASPDLPRGPFRGVPILLKDLGAHLDGDPVYSGMKLLKDLDWRESGETVFARTSRSDQVGASAEPVRTSSDTGGGAGAARSLRRANAQPAQEARLAWHAAGQSR